MEYIHCGGTDVRTGPLSRSANGVPGHVMTLVHGGEQRPRVWFSDASTQRSLQTPLDSGNPADALPQENSKY